MKPILGMRLFLYGVLSIIKDGNTESCEYVIECITVGIATKLYHKHKEQFDKIGFNPQDILEIDDYFRNCGVDYSQSNKKYSCEDNDGLLLIIKIILNEII
ncbi:MAG: hypothetical protein IKJ06_05585 [Clostridia bacterium]|nr:hypothetical protein [Clostridia bacterium]